MCSVPDCPCSHGRHIEVEERPRLSTPDYDYDHTLTAYNEIHNIVERSSPTSPPPPPYQQHIDHTLPSYNEIHNIVDTSMPAAYDQVSLPSYESTIQFPGSSIIEFPPFPFQQNSCCDKENMMAYAVGVVIMLGLSIIATLIILAFVFLL